MFDCGISPWQEIMRCLWLCRDVSTNTKGMLRENATGVPRIPRKFRECLRSATGILRMPPVMGEVSLFKGNLAGESSPPTQGEGAGYMTHARGRKR